MPPDTLEFATYTPQEEDVANQIAMRAFDLGIHDDLIDAAMDLSATHARCPLDLQKLLAFDDGNFRHDLSGIRRHLNRRSGQLERFFLPRSARMQGEDRHG